MRSFLSRALVSSVLVLAACDAGGAGLDGGGGACAPKACTGPNPGCDYCGLVPELNYGHCGGQEVYGCDTTTGQWRDDGLCEPFGIKIDSDLRLQQSVGSSAGTCGQQAPTTRTLHANADDNQVTAAAPLVVQAGAVSASLDSADVEATIVDDWGGGASDPVTITYRLHLRPFGQIYGTAVATYGTATPCAVGMTVTGSWDPAW